MSPWAGEPGTRICRARLYAAPLDITTPILDAAAALDPPLLRALDAIHVATAVSIGDPDLEVITYDDRCAAAARANGLAVVAPGRGREKVAHEWFDDHRAFGWATCALTENGFLRILSHPGADVETDRATLFASLRKFCSSGHHEFWPDGVSLRDESLFDASALVSHRQPTDVYLLGLATRPGEGRDLIAQEHPGRADPGQHER